MSTSAGRAEARATGRRRVLRRVPHSGCVRAGGAHLSATDVRNVDADLAGTPGGTTRDGQADQVIVNGSDRNDTIAVAGSNGAIGVTGLAATVTVPG